MRSGLATLPSPWLAIALLIASLGLCRPAGAAAQDAKPKAPPPTPVVVAPVREVVDAPKFTYNGFLEPLEKALVSAVEPGFVKTIEKRVGERVAQGGVLAVLTNPSRVLDLEVQLAQIKEAEAELAQARLKLARTKTLFEKNLVPAEQYENEQAAAEVIEARLRTSRAMAERLRSQLKLLVIRSPIEGQIISADLELGQWITSNTQIYQVSNFDRFELLVGVPGKFVETVPREAAVEIFVPEIGQRLTGRIAAVVQHVDANTGNFTLRLQVENPKKLPLSGLVAQATVPVGPREKVKVVPRDAIVRRGEATQVVVVRDNAAQIVPVTVRGNLSETVIVAAAELKPAEQVVVRGNERLFPGMPVQVTVAK